MDIVVRDELRAFMESKGAEGGPGSMLSLRGWPHSARGGRSRSKRCLEGHEAVVSWIRATPSHREIQTSRGRSRSCWQSSVA